MKQSELLDQCQNWIKQTQEIVEGQVMPLPVTSWLENIDGLDWSIAETAHHMNSRILWCRAPPALQPRLVPKVRPGIELGGEQ